MPVAGSGPALTVRSFACLGASQKRGLYSLPKHAFLSAHRTKGEFSADWQSVAQRDATLAIYMPGGNYKCIARELLGAGLPAATPCVIVSQASTPRQLILRLELGTLPGLPEPPSPALLLVGEVTREEAVETASAWGAAGGDAFASEETEAVG